MPAKITRTTEQYIAGVPLVAGTPAADLWFSTMAASIAPSPGNGTGPLALINTAIGTLPDGRLDPADRYLVAVMRQLKIPLRATYIFVDRFNARTYVYALEGSR